MASDGNNKLRILVSDGTATMEGGLGFLYDEKTVKTAIKPGQAVEVDDVAVGGNDLVPLDPANLFTGVSGRIVLAAENKFPADEDEVTAAVDKDYAIGSKPDLLSFISGKKYNVRIDGTLALVKGLTLLQISTTNDGNFALATPIPVDATVIVGQIVAIANETIASTVANQLVEVIAQQV